MFVFNPLAGGLLAGTLYQEGGKVVAKYEKGAAAPKEGRFVFYMYRARYWNDRNFEAVQIIKDIAQKYGQAPTDLAMAWLLTNKNVTSILSLVDYLDQLSQNVAAGEIVLSQEEINECSVVYETMLPPGFLAQELSIRPSAARGG